MEVGEWWRDASRFRVRRCFAVVAVGTAAAGAEAEAEAGTDAAADANNRSCSARLALAAAFRLAFAVSVRRCVLQCGQPGSAALVHWVPFAVTPWHCISTPLIYFDSYR